MEMDIDFMNTIFLFGNNGDNYGGSFLKEDIEMNTFTSETMPLLDRFRQCFPINV